MKTFLRSLLIHIVTLWVTTQILPGFIIGGGFKTYILGAFALMIINLAIVPLLKIMFLPLNLLTLGLFTWVVNVVGLYLLTNIIPQIKIAPFYFFGTNLGGFVIPESNLNLLQVAIITSFLLGFISHFLKWLEK